MRIKPLDNTVINQIAAGEVIERPASVIKELLENAIDAKATSVRIKLLGSGKQGITITDNGCGIHPDDLSLSIQSHATSKITQLSDLNDVSSLGFRGEALASMSSISRFSIMTRCIEQEHAFRLSIDGGECRIDPCHHEQGTTVIVNDLFYNTPARRKFLRSDKVELTHIESAIRRIAIARHDVAIECYHGDKRLLSAKACDKSQIPQRLDKLIGKNFIAQSQEISSHASGLKLWGFITTNEFFRSQSDCQYFYINNRFIKDRLITHAINTAYQDILYPGQQAGYVLFLTIDPQEFDVNVHPTKHEVRFHQPRWVHDFVVKSISQTFSGMRGEIAPIKPMPVVAEPKATYVTEKPSDPLPAKIIGQSHDDLVILAHYDDIIIVSLRRVKQYTTLLKLQQAYNAGSLTAKPLLVPVMQQVSEHEGRLIQELQSNLQNLGVSLELLMSNIVLRQLPQELSQINPQSLLKHVIEIALAQGTNWTQESDLSILAALSQGIKYDNLISETTQLLQEFFRLDPSQQQKLATIHSVKELTHEQV